MDDISVQSQNILKIKNLLGPGMKSKEHTGALKERKHFKENTLKQK